MSFPTMIFEHADYRTYLKNTLAERIAKNPAYSLRAMAKQFGVSATFLSKVNRGMKSLSADRAYLISRRLGLSEKESEYFCALVQVESARSQESKDRILKKLNSMNRKREVHNVALDQFKVISEWYHLPIVEMTRLKGFKFSPLSISRRLGISIYEAESAIERLLRLGMLEKDEQGKVRKAHKRFIAESAGKDEALQGFHKQMLEKATASLTEQDPSEKFVGMDVMALDPKQLPAVTAKINEFMDELLELVSQGEAKTEAYLFGTHLFRLTKKGSLK